jgi:hypothetical protein
MGNLAETKKKQGLETSNAFREQKAQMQANYGHQKRIQSSKKLSPLKNATDAYNDDTLNVQLNT